MAASLGGATRPDRMPTGGRPALGLRTGGGGGEGGGPEAERCVSAESVVLDFVTRLEAGADLLGASVVPGVLAAFPFSFPFAASAGVRVLAEARSSAPAARVAVSPGWLPLALSLSEGESAEEGVALSACFRFRPQQPLPFLDASLGPA